MPLVSVLYGGAEGNRTALRLGLSQITMYAVLRLVGIVVDLGIRTVVVF